MYISNNNNTYGEWRYLGKISKEKELERCDNCANGLISAVHVMSGKRGLGDKVTCDLIGYRPEGLHVLGQSSSLLHFTSAETFKFLTVQCRIDHLGLGVK